MAHVIAGPYSEFATTMHMGPYINFPPNFGNSKLGRGPDDT